jgi:hypothetical protein
MMLGFVRWMKVAADGQLHGGIRLLPGQPEPVALRPADAGDAREAYRPGFLFPPAGGERACLLLPPGYFRGERIIELDGQGGRRRFRMLQLAERGADVDRVVCEVQA